MVTHRGQKFLLMFKWIISCPLPLFLLLSTMEQSLAPPSDNLPSRLKRSQSPLLEGEQAPALSVSSQVRCSSSLIVILRSSPLQSHAFSGQVFSSSNISLYNYSRVPYTSLIAILEAPSLLLLIYCPVLQYFPVDACGEENSYPTYQVTFSMPWKDLLHLCQKLNVLLLLVPSL